MTRLLSRWLVALLVLIVAAPPAFAIRNGAVVRDPVGLRRHVVLITGPDGTKCSGTVIARRVVLTAAHCFLAGPGEYLIRSLDPKFRLHITRSATISIHPRFDVTAYGNDRPVSDIALLTVEEDLPAFLDPVPLARSVPSGDQLETVIAAGFGMSRSRDTRTAGTLRQVSMTMLDRVQSRSGMLLLDDITDRKPASRGGVCRGDSGGPVFRKTATGYVIVGVISAVVAGVQPDCGSVTAVMPVSLYLDYIDGRLGAAPALRSTSLARTPVR